MREPHEPHRFLAVQALAEMMQRGQGQAQGAQGRLADAVPACVTPLRLALNTLEPSLAGTAMLLLQRWVAGRQVVRPIWPRLLLCRTECTPPSCPCCVLAHHRLLQSEPGVGPALVPHYAQLASALCVFKSRGLVLWLPPPHCVPATGAFDGGQGRCWQL